MVFGSRGLTVSERNDKSLIENLTEHCITSISDLKAHIHHSFQIRKNVVKPDPKLKVKSHFFLFFSVYEGNKLVGKIGFSELAGSENASNDASIIKHNSLSNEEKKCIARSFNALSAVLNNENVWKESNLTLSCKDLLGIDSHKVIICTINNDPNNYKHNLASLKYVQRIKEWNFKKISKFQQEIKEELQQLRNDINENPFMAGEWLFSREELLKNLENTVKSNLNLLGSSQEAEEFLMECEILRKKLKIMKDKPLPPLPKENLRRRSASPLNEDIATDRDNYMKAKLFTLQGQNESLLKKIEDLNEKTYEKDMSIKNNHGRINDLERAVYEKDRIIQEQDFKISENNAKIAELTAKINEYTRRLKSKSVKSLSGREEQLEGQLHEAERKMIKDREDWISQVNKLKASILAKDRIIQDLEQASLNGSHEKDRVIAELRQKLKNKSMSLQETEKNLLGLTNTYNENRYRLEVEASSSKKYEEECVVLRKKYEEALIKLNTVESKSMVLVQKNDGLEKELGFVKQELDNRKFKSHQLSASLKEMETTLGISAEESQRLKFELGQLRSENQMLRIDKENIFNENTDLATENNLLKEEIKKISNQLDSTNQFIEEKEKTLGETGTHFMKKKKKKIKILKENVSLLQQQLKDCQSIAEEEIKKALDERDLALQELEECKNSQIHDLSVVENQVGVIEEQLIKLKEQNKNLLSREAELLKEVKNSESAKEKYKGKVLELKEEIKVLQGQLAEMDDFAKEYIENHRKEISEMKVGEEKAIALKSRIRAMHDVKNLIKAHRIQR